MPCSVRLFNSDVFDSKRIRCVAGLGHRGVPQARQILASAKTFAFCSGVAARAFCCSKSAYCLLRSSTLNKVHSSDVRGSMRPSARGSTSWWLGESGLVLGALQPHLPLTEHRLIAPLEFLQRRERELHSRASTPAALWRRWRCRANRNANSCSRGRACVAALCGARVHGYKPPLPRYRTVSARPQVPHSISPCSSASLRAPDHSKWCTCIDSIFRQAILVREELLPRDIALVMRGKVYAPLRHRHRWVCLMTSPCGVICRRY